MKLKIKNKRVKILLIILGIVLILLLGIVIGRLTASNSMKDISMASNTTSQIVEVEVGTQTIENTLTSSGEISTNETEKLTLNTSYYFNQMCVEENDLVLKGENILKYSNGNYLTAEYDCVISSYSVPESGNICTSSNYVEVKNMETLVMTLNIDESEVNSIKVGQEVEIELNAFEDTTYKGAISKINSVGTYSTSGTSFTATVEFENDGNIKLGMSASCTIIIEKAEDVIAVPIEAVQTSNNKKYVVVAKEDGTTENVDIETGISNDSYVEVKSGLSGGEKIQMVSTSTSKFSKGNEKMNMQGGDFFNMDFPDMKQSGDMQIPNGGGMPNMN